MKRFTLIQSSLIAVADNGGVFMKKGSLENKCSGIEQKFNGVIQLKDVLLPLFINTLLSVRCGNSNEND